MTAAPSTTINPTRIAPGVKFHYDGDPWTVVGLDGITLRARGPQGLSVFSVAEIAAYADFVGTEPEAETRDDGRVVSGDDFPGLWESISSPEQRSQASQRLRLVNIVLTGYPDGMPTGDQDPYAFGPQSGETMKSRIQALADAEGVSPRTLERWCSSYRKHGPDGLIDKRSVSIRDPLGDCPEQVRAAIHHVMALQTNRSKVTGKELARQVRNVVKDRHGVDFPMPPDRSMRRYISEMSRTYGLHLSTKTRQGNQLRPRGQFKTIQPTRPFEIVEIDSTRLDAFAISPVDGKPTPVTVTVALDIYTRAPVAWRFSAGEASSVDATMLIYDMVSPKTLNPSWDPGAAWRFGIPETLVLRSTKNNEPLAGVPFGVPTTLSLDNGGIYISEAARGACARLGISLQYARLARPTDKPHIERFFNTMRTQFSERLPGYKGPSVDYRGTKKEVEDKAELFVWEIEDLFGEWVASQYMHTPHDGLLAPGLPGMRLTPAEAYNRGIAIAGFVTTPMSPQLAVSLLPSINRAVTRQGIEVDGLLYNSDDLDPYRGMKSPFGELNGKWPIRVDNRDRSHVWFYRCDPLEPTSGEWIRIPSNVALGQQPFSDIELQYVKRLFTDADRAVGRDRNSDVLARSLERYIHRLQSEGPANAREARVAGIGRGRIAQAERDFLNGHDEQDREPLTGLGADEDVAHEPHIHSPAVNQLHSVANIEEMSEDDFFADEEAS